MPISVQVLDPYVKLEEEVMKGMLDLAELKDGEVYMDLGCGDGQFLEEAEKRGATATGVEYNHAVVSLATAKDLTVIEGNVFDADVSKADVITFWFTEKGTRDLFDKLYKEMKEGTQCKKIRISKEQYKKLVEYISSSFQIENDQSINIKTKAKDGKYDAFYEANGSYSMVKTCNTWANNALKHSGQRCCFWTPFDKGIFEKYN
jgi:cyclopropane fatty-acyl-phospholipid synthase-like methyltransferase